MAERMKMNCPKCKKEIRKWTKEREWYCNTCQYSWKLDELKGAESGQLDTIVMRDFTEDDLDNCWEYYKAYLIDILNGEYKLEDARDDLRGLIDSKFDKRQSA